MSTEAIDLVSLEALLARRTGQSCEGDPGDVQTEHPLARELRSVLANPQGHQIGDLARVVDHILREMAMFKAGNGPTFDPDR